MQNLFKELAWKCFRNDLGFEYMEHGTVTVWHHTVERATQVSSGSMHCGYETPVSALKRMDKEVDEFIKTQSMEDTEPETDNLTSYERQLKESGHVEADFYEGEFK